MHLCRQLLRRLDQTRFYKESPVTLHALKRIQMHIVLRLVLHCTVRTVPSNNSPLDFSVTCG